MKAMTPMPCLLAVLSALGMVTLFTSAAAQPSEPDLRAGFQQRKQAQEQQVAETAQRKAAECLAAEQRFSELDLYRSSDGSRILGLDLRGRIWMMTNRNGICKLQSSQQLNKPDYSVDWTGQRTWITYHYENNHLCRYQRNPGTQQVRQSCYQPIGVVNRYAPYFLN
jgi:hypothetical protein